MAVLGGASPSEAQELRLGLTSGPNEVEVRAEVEPLTVYLTKTLGRTVSLSLAKTEGDLQRQMEAGAVDIGIFSPLAYVDAARGGQVRVVAQSVVNGSTTYPGIIIKRFDSHIESLADLEGKRVAFVDATSVSGFLFPRGSCPARC
jgi:phosphonate transport system substrate-binding protein